MNTQTGGTEKVSSLVLREVMTIQNMGNRTQIKTKTKRMFSTQEMHLFLNFEDIKISLPISQRPRKNPFATPIFTEF